MCRLPSINLAWLLLIVSGLLVACDLADDPSSTAAQSAWGTALTLASAEQANAPALWVANDRVTAAWVGADDTGVHQDTRVLTSSGLSDTVVLPLPPVHPYAQTIYPGQLNYTHFLWLDAAETGQNRLYSALITPELTVERGPTPVSNAHTLRYTALAVGDGSLQTVWSGGLLAEPALYYQSVDVAGRPGSPLELTVNADWPSLIRANDGTRYLFWLRPSDKRLFYAVLNASGLSDITEIASLSEMQPGTRLINIQGALDTTHLYVFWNTVLASGTAQTWFISREIAGTDWSTPTRIGISLPDLQADTTDAMFETGFNSGRTLAVEAGSTAIRWAAPLTGQYAVLPVAAEVQGLLALLYFQGGQVRGYQAITTTDLIGLPALAVDQDRYLYLAWAQPGTAQADLRLTSLRLDQWSAALPAAD